MLGKCLEIRFSKILGAAERPRAHALGLEGSGIRPLWTKIKRRNFLQRRGPDEDRGHRSSKTTDMSKDRSNSRRLLCRTSAVATSDGELLAGSDELAFKIRLSYRSSDPFQTYICKIICECRMPMLFVLVRCMPARVRSSQAPGGSSERGLQRIQRCKYAGRREVDVGLLGGGAGRFHLTPGAGFAPTFQRNVRPGPDNRGCQVHPDTERKHCVGD